MIARWTTVESGPFVGSIQLIDTLTAITSHFKEPGDLVMADHDGVVVIPQAVAAEVVEHAEAKVAIEKKMRNQLDGGALVSDAFRQFGVL